ncbi:hypothetical protein RY831_17025 [Noviherbaspirillum sp. CPCC 100848]|uniref:Uncharacterized protein n=1 Tax=Noviherbaspirillum album TaxID=3080276 RepID=A0ABU6JB62_9BURK|nr:hypothetical protein [Noviherbaspirillum sp. CPCC 100848]MEC4720871.1 hypothetical protein [Noviherbaspirillum sp. CPCC 100848]
MQDANTPPQSKPSQQSQPSADRPAPGSLEDLNVTAPYTSDAAGSDEADRTRGQPAQDAQDANNRDRHGLENQSVTKPAPIDVEQRH